MVGDPTDLPENPTKAECTQVARSLPVICKMFGKKSCVAFNSKMSAKCGADAAFNMEDDNEDIREDDDEEMASSDDDHALADEDDSNEVADEEVASTVITVPGTSLGEQQQQGLGARSGKMRRAAAVKRIPAFRKISPLPSHS